MELPKEFISYSQDKFGDEWQDFVDSLNSESPVSIRLNKRKYDQSQTSLSEVVPWCNTGYYLQSRPQFTFDPLFHAGCYYVQEASSMFIEQVFKQYVGDNIRILDLCASPGGKSTLISSLIDDNSILISNEIIKSRANILVENIMKWGMPNVMVTNNTPSEIGNNMPSFFDVILVDAPCSGEGMFRKDIRAIEEWSIDNVKLCKKRQQDILSDIWSALKPGGILIYSTCTYNIEENEENIMWIKNELKGDVLPITISEDWHVTDSFIDGIDAYRFLPHKTKGEGFFCSVIRKDDNEENQFKNKTQKTNNKKRNKDNKNSSLLLSLKDYLIDHENLSIIEKNKFCVAHPSMFAEELSIIESSLHVMVSGIVLGEFKNTDFIPNQSLALSTRLNKNMFSNIDVDWHTAIKFLKKEPIDLPNNVTKGCVLISYKNKPIGFVKNIGSRSNNLYPSSWRIRSNNLPSAEINII